MHANEHQAIAQRNEAFQATIDKARFADWTVTALFYSALHYVDAVLVANFPRPKNHPERNQLMPRHPKTRAIWGKYRGLEDESRNARYNGAQPNAAQLQALIADFNAVKTQLS